VAPPEHPDFWLVGALAAIAFGLRWACFHQSLFGDELILYIDVHGHSLGQVFSVVHDTEKTPPSYFLLGWLFARGNDAMLLVRVPTLIASVATVPIIYLLGVRTVGRRAAVVATAWFAISPFELFYGTEGRSYALVTMLVVLSTLSLVLALEQRRLRWWMLYVASATASVYTHYIGALILVPQAAWALWVHRESVREQLLSHALVVLLWLPWLPSFLVQFRHSAKEAEYLSHGSPATISHVSQITATSLVGLPFTPLRQLPGRPTVAVLALVALGVLLALGSAVYRRRGDRQRLVASRVSLIAALAVAPLIALCLYTIRPHTSFLIPRNLSVAVPYVLVLFGWALTRPRAPLSIALSAIALLAVGIGTVKAVSPSYQRPDTRDAAHYIDARAPAAASVVDVELISNYKQKPARATRLYFRRPHHVYPASAYSAAWDAAARTGAPVFVTYPHLHGIEIFLPVPAEFASRYRLVAEHTTPGTPYGIAVREYARN
jgi:hypothetical protein